MTHLVGLDFNEFVMNETKDVFVMLYAPWCGHSNDLAPIWMELAEHYNKTEDLLIAMYDETMNEVEGISIEEYPTLIFYPRNNKQGVRYTS